MRAFRCSRCSVAHLVHQQMQREDLARPGPKNTRVLFIDGFYKRLDIANGLKRFSAVMQVLWFVGSSVALQTLKLRG